MTVGTKNPDSVCGRGNRRLLVMSSNHHQVKHFSPITSTLPDPVKISTLPVRY